jgi:hypothetical protein
VDAGAAAPGLRHCVACVAFVVVLAPTAWVVEPMTSLGRGLGTGVGELRGFACRSGGSGFSCHALGCHLLPLEQKRVGLVCARSRDRCVVRFSANFPY